LTALTLDTHTTPEGRCFINKGDDDPFFHSLKCADRYFADFMADLERENLLTDDLTLIITADHLYPSFIRFPGHQFRTSFVMEPGKIPFFLMTREDIKLKATTGSHLDVAATLLDLANLETPGYYMGKSLISNNTQIPMGQDRLDGYMITDGIFNSISLNPTIQLATTKEGPTGITLKVSPDATKEEIDAKIELAGQELKAQRNRQTSLFKWYYNKFSGYY
jgi:hypothetical protein